MKFHLLFSETVALDLWEMGELGNKGVDISRFESTIDHRDICQETATLIPCWMQQ